MWEESEMARKCGVHLKLLCKATPPAASPLMFESETVSTNATSSKLKEPFTIFRNLPSDTSVSCSTLQDLVPGCGESEKAEKQRAELARAFTEEMAALGELRAHDLLAFEGSECAESETCQYALAEGWVEVDAVKMKTGSGKEVEHLARGGKKKKPHSGDPPVPPSGQPPARPSGDPPKPPSGDPPKPPSGDAPHPPSGGPPGPPPGPPPRKGKEEEPVIV